MWELRAVSGTLGLLILYTLVAFVSADGNGWKTLGGSPPLVMARGGFSGVFPDSSSAAYALALKSSLQNVILWCDVQLTKNGTGICFPELKLDNATDISFVYPGKIKNYPVNGISTRGYFSIDYNLDELQNVFLVQGIYSRTNKFDGNKFNILTVEDVMKLVKPHDLWLNIQHAAFFKQQNLNVTSFLVSLSGTGGVSYISSPDIGFLRSIRSHYSSQPRIVFRFLGQNEFEPSTKKTYGSFLKNLKDISKFASGILVPKSYIWPVDSDLYLQPHTSLVSDAHKAGLKVFASDIVNDIAFSYNYSYDPLAECLSFIDNVDFSIDGILSDFPVTPSAAIDCFSYLSQKNDPKQVNTTVISKYGASGDYPACTDLAYNKAISDGADVIDCPVQMSKDSVPFCLSSIDLVESTTVLQSNFSKLSTTIPEIKPDSGVFTFSLTWNEIKSLQTSILNPYQKYRLFRNPKFKNAGKLLTLSEFLSLTTGRTSGILISIENAAYLAEKQGLSVKKAVLDALRKAGYDKPGSQRVMIQSTHSSLLKDFKGKTDYEMVYKVDESIYDVDDLAVQDIKTFADSVVVGKSSVYIDASYFLTNVTNTVSKLKSNNLKVYVETFSNEFVSQAWDYYSDAFYEINTFVFGANVDGIITDFPKTADRYRRNRCLQRGNGKPAYMMPAEPGVLLQKVTQEYYPPPAPPLPVLKDINVTEPPSPSVPRLAPAPSFGAAAPALTGF